MILLKIVAYDLALEKLNMIVEQPSDRGQMKP